MIVLTTVLIVLAPVVTSQFSEEIARWHLAAAANAVELGIGDQEESMRKAKEVSADIFGLRDYWLLLLQQTLDQNPTKLPELVRFAKTKDPNLARLGALAIRALEAEGQYALAVDVLEESLTPEARGLQVNLNLLAYMRSLAGVELEKARKDINEALKYSPNDPALRDTRAWVLFKLGELEQALEDADFAVKETERRKLSNPLRFLESWGSESIQVKEGSPGPDAPSKAEVPQSKSLVSNSPESETRDADLPHSEELPEAEVSEAEVSEAGANQAGTTGVGVSDDAAASGERANGAKTTPPASLPPASLPPVETVSAQTFQEGVLRYHRGRILEKLGREAEMEQDWQWLRQHKLPINDSLH